MMSKFNRRKMNNTGRCQSEQFVKLTRNVLESAAWRDLSNCAVRIYLEVRKRYNGTNNGNISLSCREAAKIAQCGKGTASSKMQELVDHGFIKEAKKGMYTYREASTWILTNEVYNNQSPTNEWKLWPDQKQNKVPVIELVVPEAELMVTNSALNRAHSSMTGTEPAIPPTRAVL